MRPFLRWVTRKPSVVHEISKYVPKEYGRYFEPFLGGGSLFFLLEPKKAYLSDSIPTLISTYRAVRDLLPEVLVALNPNEEEYPTIEAVRAAQFICAVWNDKIPSNSVLAACSGALQGQHIISADYHYLGGAAPPVAGDFVYLDPPFWYGDERDKKQVSSWQTFGLREHKEVRDFVYDLTARGVKVLVSLADSEEMYKLYNPPQLQRIQSLYWKATELLVTTYGY